MESKIKQTAINFVQTEYAPYHKLDLNDKTCFDAEVKHYEEFAKYIFEQGSIQSPDADNTERGESEKQIFLNFISEIVDSVGEVEKARKMHSGCATFKVVGGKSYKMAVKPCDMVVMDEPTPPTLLNELRENADKQAIEFAEWLIVNDVQEGEGLTSTYWMNYEPYTLQELLELFKQSKANKP